MDTTDTIDLTSLSPLRRDMLERRLHITPRGRQVAELVMAGLQSKDIAKELGMAERTVKSHLNRLYLQLNIVGKVGRAGNRVKLVTYLYEHRQELCLTYMARERLLRPKKESLRSLQRATRIKRLEAELEQLRHLSSNA